MLWRESNSISYILCQYETKSHFYQVLKTISQDKFLLLIIPDTSMYESTEKTLEQIDPWCNHIEFTGIKLVLTWHVYGVKVMSCRASSSCGLTLMVKVNGDKQSSCHFSRATKDLNRITQKWQRALVRLLFFLLPLQSAESWARKKSSSQGSSLIPYDSLCQHLGNKWEYLKIASIADFRTEVEEKLN